MMTQDSRNDILDVSPLFFSKGIVQYNTGEQIPQKLLSVLFIYFLEI